MKKPFERKRIDAIIHQLELGKKDQKSDFGMQILYSILPGWSNKLDPFDSLSIDETLTRFKEDLDKKGDHLFHDLIEKYILDKPCFKFSMRGSEDFSEMLEAEEKTRLADKVSKLNTEDEKVIYDRGIVLQEMQQKKEDVSCLPSLQIEDIPRIGEKYDVKKNANIKYRMTDTNDITYIRAKRSLNNIIPFELYPYLPLFADSLTSLGTATESYSDIEDSMKLYTGGVSAHINTSADPISLQPHLYFGFDGWSLNSKSEHIFEIWEKLLLNTDFKRNSDKLKTLIRLQATSNTSSVAESGHLYARGYAAASLDVTKSINEKLNGIEQLQLINKLNMMLEDEEIFQKEVVDKLIRIQKLIINSQGLEFFVTTDTEHQGGIIQTQVSNFIAKMPHKSPQEVSDNTLNFPLIPSTSGISTLINFPFQVHYASECLRGVSYTHNDGAPLQILSNLLTFKYLHREIREKGGAYGGGASYDALSGIFGYYSYRDPQPLRSLKTFKSSAEYVLNNAQWTKTELDDAKLTIFQQIDAPTSRKGEGVTEFLTNVTEEMRQTRREQLLDTRLSDIERVAQEYLLNKEGVSAVVGPVIEGETMEPKWNIKNL